MFNKALKSGVDKGDFTQPKGTLPISPRDAPSSAHDASRCSHFSINILTRVSTGPSGPVKLAKKEAKPAAKVRRRQPIQPYNPKSLITLYRRKPSQRRKLVRQSQRQRRKPHRRRPPQPRRSPLPKRPPPPRPRPTQRSHARRRPLPQLLQRPKMYVPLRLLSADLNLTYSRANTY